jgi:hypothetical protein
MGTDEDIPEDELLSIPSDNLFNLSRLRTVRSTLLYQKQMTELAAERAGTARPFTLFPDRDPRARHEEEERRRALLAQEQATQEVRDHADRLLLRLDEQQHEIDRRRTELEGRALHLHDGRRVWIDGDQYRNDSGAILQGNDHDEAQSLAAVQPEAATWAEHEHIRLWADRTKRLKEQVLSERERAAEGDPARLEERLSGYEKELQEESEERASHIAAASVNYGDPDYSDLLSSQPSFNAAAHAESAVAPADKTEADSASADNKRTFRQGGQGAPKPC